VVSLDGPTLLDDDERVPMTTPDGTTPEPETPDHTSARPATAGPHAITREGAWGAVARLLAIQLLTVVAVTAVITGIYALTGRGENRATAGGASSGTPTGSLSPSSPPSSAPPSQPTTEPSVDPSASATSSPATPTSSEPPVRTHLLKVDVLNQSAAKGAAGRFAARIRDLHWRVGRVDNFHGTVSTTTVYYPQGRAKAAHELARGLPGNLRVLPRFSTLSDSRLTLILAG
jgi:hypothetical protein